MLTLLGCAVGMTFGLGCGVGMTFGLGCVWE